MAASPFHISLIDLPRQEGNVIFYDVQLDAPSDMRLEMVRIPEGSPLDISLTLSSVSEGVYVSGSVTAHMQGLCSRCLRELSADIREDIAELVYYPERVVAMRENGDEEAEECYVVTDERIDIEPIIRDALVLALPFGPLCSPDCAGLCPDCGERLDDLPQDHAHEPVYDSRFDALAALEEELRKG